jgi:Fur family peroxide stress response transcriptional regulator
LYKKSVHAAIPIGKDQQFRIILNLDKLGFRIYSAPAMNVVEKKLNDRLTERLGAGGLRSTPQREHVFHVLVQKRDHPTAEEVFIRSKKTMPDISMATVYNCLDALVKCRLVRQVQLERGATRYCPNMEEHCHYYCDGCGTVFDVALTGNSTVVPRPKGFKIDHYEIAVHGICADCAKKKK